MSFEIFSFHSLTSIASEGVEHCLRGRRALPQRMSSIASEGVEHCLRVRRALPQRASSIVAESVEQQ
eukprot:1523206-Pleurochrysis_carterae.AAC.1